jgi:hypothetical protein
VDERLTRLLEDLGPTADAVAAALRVRGVRGVRNAARSLNPVVRCVRPAVPDALDLELWMGCVLRISRRGVAQASIPVPRPVLAFLDGFHLGRYPDLELGPDEAGGPGPAPV